MKISFLGTAAAEGVPAMFCSCGYCQNIRKLGFSEYRTRSQVLIDDDLSIDFPPEAYYHSLRFSVDYSSLKYLLVTHSHMDHFYAHDFVLRGYKYAELTQEVLNIYGNEEIKKVFDECTARELKKEVSPHISVNVIHNRQKLELGAYTVLALPAKHQTAEDALLYYIQKNGKGYLHLYDTGDVSDEALNYLKANGAKANVVAFDCTFLENSCAFKARHMGVEDNMIIKQKLLSLGIIDQNTTIVITHFSHHANPTSQHLKQIEQKYNVIAAYDGMQLEI